VAKFFLFPFPCFFCPALFFFCACRA
jgi:hypothetical protein